MPMGGKLDDAQIALIRAWVEQEKHWAFVAPKRPASGINGIDGFIRARLEREGLKPSPEADSVTLLRRASLDVIGLPPDWEG